MMIDPTAYIYLGFRGDFDPIAASKLVDLAPEKCAPKHSINPERRIPRTNLLDYAKHGTNEACPDIYQLADQVTEILEPHLTQLEQLIAQFQPECTFQVVLWIPKDEEISTPILGFSSRTIQLVSRLGAHIDIDSYRY